MRNEVYKGRVSLCYVGTKAVDSKEQPTPFFSSYYYPYFEYSAFEKLDADKIAEQLKTYLEEYRAKALSLRIHYDNYCYCFCTDSFLTSKCEECIEHYISKECADCRKQDERLRCSARRKRNCSVSCDFTRQIQIKLAIKSDYACPENKKSVNCSSVCYSCRYDPPDSTPYGLGRKITVHDLRFHGHPVSLQLLYTDHRCAPKKELLKNLPGIYRGSGSNQIRYSIRLAERINAALIEGIPRNYISEATSISYDSIRSWLRREKEKSEKMMRKRLSDYSFVRSKEFEITISEPIRIGHSDFIVCLQREDDRSAAITGIYPVEEWHALEMLFMGNIENASENLFLRRMHSHLEECFLYSDMLFNFLSAYCPIEPGIATYIATRLLLTHFHWGLVLYPDMPQEYQSFYETCWDTLWDLVATEGEITDPLRYLKSLLALSPDDNRQFSQYEKRTISTWYHEIKKELHGGQLHHCIAKPCENRFLQIDISQLGEYSESATVSEADVPVLLQYYNPIVAPHFKSDTGTSFEYLFDYGGDFNFAASSVPLPGIELDDVIALIRAGILVEYRTETEPISVSLMNRIRPTP